MRRCVNLNLADDSDVFKCDADGCASKADIHIMENWAMNNGKPNKLKLDCE